MVELQVQPRFQLPEGIAALGREPLFHPGKFVQEKLDAGPDGPFVMLGYFIDIEQDVLLDDIAQLYGVKKDQQGNDAEKEQQELAVENLVVSAHGIFSAQIPCFRSDNTR